MWMFEGVIREFLDVLPVTLLLTAILFVISLIIRRCRGSHKHSLILLLTAGGFLGAFITWPIFAWFRSRRKQHV